MIFCFGGSLKTHTKFVCLESVRVGHIDTLDTHDPVGAAPYNGIWGTCAPSGRNMHHQGAICTMVHKGDYMQNLTNGQCYCYSRFHLL